jgi:hypothetical protein
MEKLNAATLPERLTVELAVRYIREIVYEVGFDHVYEPPTPEQWCRYVHSKESGVYDDTATVGCLAGRVLHEAGVSLAELCAVEGKSVRLLPDKWLTKGAKVVLQAVQSAQDSKCSWGRTLALAEQMAYMVDDIGVE